MQQAILTDELGSFAGHASLQLNADAGGMASRAGVCCLQQNALEQMRN